jgi:CubicO group peptidase (beta-lactamase class C family)
MTQGFVAPGYEQVRAAADGLDAQIAAYVDGELVVDLGDRALRCVYSSTKGVLGAVVALLTDRGALDLDRPVASIWPAFGAGGKAAVTVRQALSHQAGLPFLDGGMSKADLLDHDLLAARVAAQAPMWEPGTGFAYHSITIGTIGDELARRITGATVAELHTQHLAPGIELHLGPTAPDGVAQVPGPTEADLQAWAELLGPAQPGSLAARAAAQGEPPMFEFVQTPEFRRTGQPAAAGVGSARGLAAFYAQGPSRVSDRALAQVTREQVHGTDLLLGRQSRFGVVFQLPTPEDIGPPTAFGHPGGGGSQAFLDGRLAFGFVPTRFPGLGQEPRVRAVVDAIRAAMTGPGVV